MLRGLLLLGIIGLLFSCGNDAPQNNSTPTPPPQNTPAPPVGKQLYPSVSSETMQYLAANCDYVDYIFYNANFSMNRSDKGDIVNSLSHISPQPALIVEGCQPTARISFQVQGEIKLDAELYFGPNCNYFVFIENKQPKFANKMTPDGITFINNVFNQVRGMNK